MQTKSIKSIRILRLNYGWWVVLIIIINEGINFLTEENSSIIKGARFIKGEIFEIE